MATSGIKREYQLAASHPVELMQQLAELFSQEQTGGKSVRNTVLHNFSKMEIKAKRGDSGLKVKITISPAEVNDGSAVGKKGYKALKKRLQKSFKAISNDLAVPRIPDAGTVEAFLFDARSMISFPGYGDEYYDPFQKGLEEFAAVYETQALDAVRAAFENVRQLKKACHDRYK